MMPVSGGRGGPYNSCILLSYARASYAFGPLSSAILGNTGCAKLRLTSNNSTAVAVKERVLISRS